MGIYIKLKQFEKQNMYKIKNDDEYDMQIVPPEEKMNDDYILSPLKLAMKYKFVTEWTSMIVVKHKLKKSIYEFDDSEWSMKQNFNEWTTNDILEWISLLNDDFDEKYSDKFLFQEISGDKEEEDDANERQKKLKAALSNLWIDDDDVV